MENEFIKINKLNCNENWVKWKLQMMIILKSYEAMFTVINLSYNYQTLIIKLDKESSVKAQLCLLKYSKNGRC